MGFSLLLPAVPARRRLGCKHGGSQLRKQSSRCSLQAFSRHERKKSLTRMIVLLAVLQLSQTAVAQADETNSTIAIMPSIPLPITPLPANSTPVPVPTTPKPTNTPTQMPATPMPTTAPDPNDFARLNQILNDIEVSFPDATLIEEVVNLKMRNVVCTNFRIDDLVIESYQVDSTSSRPLDRTNIRLKVIGLDMFCQADYEYTVILFPLGGRADFYLYDNEVIVSMDFNSADTVYPKEVTVEDCSPAIEISNIEFHGDVTAVVWETVEVVIRDYIQSAANDRICTSVTSFTSTFATDLLVTADKVIQSYYSENVEDPLSVEKRFAEEPHSVALLDLQDSTISQWELFDELLSRAVEYATDPVENSFGDVELNINQIIRDSLLDEQGALTLENVGRYLFQLEDTHTSTSMFLQGVKIYGLDTITSFDPLSIIGNYTVQNMFTWESLSLDLDIDLNIYSTAENKTEQDIASDLVSDFRITERVSLVLGAKNVETMASFLFAVDKQKLGALTLGSFLVSDHVLDCLFSIFEEAILSGLSIEAVDLVPPQLEGFVSIGLDRILTKSVDIAFDLYESTLLMVTPIVFDTTFKQFVNNKWLDKESNTAVTGRECPRRAVSVSQDGFVDFRDLLLPPNDALALGGTGEQPYGDIVYGIVSRFKEELTTEDENGLPGINAMLRSRFPDMMGPSAATFYLGDPLDWMSVVKASGLSARVEVKLLDTRIENLDSFGSPLELLELIAHEPHKLNNSAAVGIGPNPVRLSMKLSLIISDGADFTFDNFVSLEVDLSGANLALILGLQIREENFFATSVDDALNPACWAVNAMSDSKLVERVTWEQQLSVENLGLNVSCIECSSPDFEALIYYLYNPEDSTTRVRNIVNILQDNNAFDIVLDTVVQELKAECSRRDGNETTFSTIQRETELGETKRDATFLYFNIANSAISVFFVSVFFLGRRMVRSQQTSWFETLPEEALERLRRREILDMAKETVLNETTFSMSRSPQLSLRVRLTVPLLLLATIGIQIAGHLLILSTVDLVGHIAGEPFYVKKFFFFSIISITERAYANSGFEMALMLVLFTVVWPYIKLSTCLIVWFVPPSMLSVSKRKAILHWVDVFARLSIVDIATMLIGVALVLVFINETTASDPIGNLFATEVVVVPNAGFYCLIVAQRIARASARYLLDCHDHIITSTTIQRVRTGSYQDDELSLGSIIDNTSEKAKTNDSHSTASTNSLQKSDDDESMEPLRLDSGSFDNAVGGQRGQLNERYHWVQMDNGSREAFEVSIQIAGSTLEETSAEDELLERERQTEFWRKVAAGLTVFTVLVIGLIGCVLAPSISIDAQAVWDILQSGLSFEEVVREYSFFRVEYLVLVNGRFVLDSPAEKIGLLCLFLAGVIAIVAIPLLKTTVAFRSWVLRHEKSMNFSSVGRATLRSLIAIPLQIRDWLKFMHGAPISFSREDNDLDLLPYYRLSAWCHLLVYVIAFIIACWQLGAAASYTIYTYCYVLQSTYMWLAYLGLVENSAASCFRIQSQSIYSIAILCTTYSVLLLLFVFEAKGKYRRVMSDAANRLRDK